MTDIQAMPEFSEERFQQMLKRASEIEIDSHISFDDALLIASGNNHTDAEIEELIRSESIGPDSESDRLKERNELEAKNLIEDLANNECNISSEDAIAFVSVNSGDRDILRSKYLLIHDLNNLEYTISSTDAQAFVSSNLTLDRTTMCAMYILSIIESKVNNDNNSSADHASADHAVAPHDEEAHDHDNSEWACGVCTFLNHIDLLQCEMCEIIKPN